MEEVAPTQSLLDVVIEEYNQDKDKRSSRLLLTSRVRGLRAFLVTWASFSSALGSPFLGAHVRSRMV